MDVKWSTKRFFAELTPRLERARVRAAELDRELAPRFNVFDYVRNDELGLSRIIADLLDPKASHGQGTVFLRSLLSLEGLRTARRWPTIDSRGVQVVVKPEHVIQCGRRLDVFVEIGTDEQRYCLAIENKPYAGDHENQVQDYLAWLNGKYPERFLLLYISPNGERPSEWSIRKAELEKWRNGFAIMPYCEGSEERTDKDPFRIPHSFADWIGECRRNCEADRLRGFLREFEIFCNRRFGEPAMTSDSERNAASEFILSQPDHLETAQAVFESWPDVKAHVCQQFLKRLCSRIETSVKENETLKEFADDMHIDYKYEDKAWKTNVWLYRECWTQYRVEQQLHGRTSITLSNEHAGPNGWGFSVSSPMSREEMPAELKERRQRLDTKFVSAFGCGRITDRCPWWWDKVDEDKKNWSSLVPDLHQECKEQSDEITKYFVDKFTEIAVKAIPVINDIEG